LTPRPSLRTGCALSLVATGATGLVPAVAQSDSPGTTSSVRHIGIDAKHLDVRAGRSVAVRGSVPAAAGGATASLQLRRGHRWRTIDRDRSLSGGRYALRARMRSPLSAPARVVMRSGGAALHRRVGRVNVFRSANASWYGPGLYGNRLGCGGTLTSSRLGVAHKTLPCGSKVTLRHGNRLVRVKVIDRGPYVGGRDYDLTAATARRLGFHGHGAIQTTK
jgi:rare lipoprotein A